MNQPRAFQPAVRNAAASTHRTHWVMKNDLSLATDAICVIGWIDSQNALERMAHSLLIVEAALVSDFGHRQVCVLDNNSGALSPEPFDELGRWHSALTGENPLEVANAHLAALRQNLDGERAIQVFGGIGFTWEHPLHTYYKRALWIQAYGGYSREQRAKIAAWLLD